MKKTALVSSTLALFALTLTGCGVLIGNTRPVEEKSEAYEVSDLSKYSQNWVKLPSQGKADRHDDDADDEPTQYSDMAFKARDTHSIIALNSACRPGYSKQNRDLRIFTEQLMLGLTQIKEKNAEDVQVAGAPALLTTVEGRLNGSDVKMRLIVLKKNSCLYDLMYLSKPGHFTVHEKEFQNFVSTLRLQ